MSQNYDLSETNQELEIKDNIIDFDEVFARTSTKSEYVESLDSDSLLSTFGERSLWRAVITQALMDAGIVPKNKYDRHDQARAIAWLSGKSEDFLYVCMLADLDPSDVRKKSKKAISNGCVWKKDRRLKRRLKNLKSVRKKIKSLDADRQSEQNKTGSNVIKLAFK